MPLPSITELSDDDAGAGLSVAEGSVAREAEDPPAPDPPAPVPKAKAGVKKDKTVKTPKAKPGDKQKTGSSALKRPAARTPPLKKPAAAGPVKAYKYMYYKEGKYGIKYNGREVMTVFASNHFWNSCTLKCHSLSTSNLDLI